MLRLYYWTALVVVVVASLVNLPQYESCPGILNVQCNRDNYKRLNIPLIRSVYCYNNGTGICKAIAGRFEFYFNSFTSDIIGPVESSQYVDKYGYHARVPIAYNVKGDLVFNDRVINWAKSFVGSGDEDDKKIVKFNLLYLKGINWCAYVERDNWPYRSAISDPYTNGSYHIYFFNKQSCITKNGKVDTQYNTRFTHKTNLRIDQDMNPLIFVMEDNLADEASRFRIVKNKRQHWVEMTYKIIDLSNGRHFIKFGDRDEEPQLITNQRGPLLNKETYRKWNSWPASSDCMTDEYFYRANESTRNSRLVETHCGLEENEMADYNRIERRYSNDYLYEVALHCLPRWPKVTQSFFAVSVVQRKDWEEYAKDGLAFTAYTTAHSGRKDTLQVIMMYAEFRPEAKDQYDEFWPVPYLVQYNATKTNKNSNWNFKRPTQPMVRPRFEMNFVDDIAYLPYCQTILVILGPLYSEMPWRGFVDNQDEKFRIGSIDKLGLFEIVNAFFADPNSHHIYFYHRTNFIAKHEYTCGSNDGQRKLVTARKVDRYRYRHGADRFFDVFPAWNDYRNKNPSEESFFKELNVFKGSLDYPDAPDPSEFPYDDADIAPAPESTSNTWLIVLIALAVIIILTLCLICLFKWRKKLFGPKKYDVARPTERSGFFSTSSAGGRMPTDRSAMRTNAPGSSAAITLRSGVSSNKASSATATTRSAMTARPGPSARTIGDRISHAFGVNGGRTVSPSSGSQSRSASRSSSVSRRRAAKKV